MLEMFRVGLVKKEMQARDENFWRGNLVSRILRGA
jgi:hypothetical protein